MKKIKLTKGKLAIVDDEDFDRLSAFKWHCDSGYAKRLTYDPHEKRKHITMQSQVLGFPGGIIDHINRNRLDNRKENLRITCAVGNAINRPTRTKSGYRGVSFNKGLWQAQIKAFKCRYCLGSFKNIKDAARAYDKKAKEIHGELAQLNFKE